MTDGVAKTFRVQTLGDWALRTPTGEVVLVAGKPIALITYLAHHPRRMATRDHLVELLHADLDPARARATFRQQLMVTRRVLGAEGLVSVGDTIRLDAPVTTDALELTALVARGDMSAACECYSGPFVDGFASPGASAFESWCDLERRRYSRMFLDSGERVVQMAQRDGDFQRAMSIARRMRTEAPDDESVARFLLQTLISAGEFVGADVEAMRLEDEMRADGREAEEATRILIRRARRIREEEPAEGERLHPALAGREREFAQVLRGWDDVQRGAGLALFVIGAAGFGKTRLLHEARRRLRGKGAPTIVVDARRAEREVPFAFAAALALAVGKLAGASGVSNVSARVLVSLQPELAEFFRNAVGEDDGGNDLLLRRTTAIADLLYAVSDERGIVLLLDDLHWADAESRRIVDVLASRLERRRILLVGAMRPPATVPQEATTVALEPLSAQQMLQLIESLAAVQESDRWFVDDIIRLARGTPFIALQLLQLLLERGAVSCANETWTVTDSTAVRAVLGVESVVQTRIEALDQSVRVVLNLLAVAGEPLSEPEIVRALDVDLGTVRRALDELTGRDLVVSGAERWRVSHDEIAAAVNGELSPIAIASLCGALGGHLANGRSDTGTTSRAARYLLAAGEHRLLAAMLVRELGATPSAHNVSDAVKHAERVLREPLPPATHAEFVRLLPLRLRARRFWAAAGWLSFAALLIVAVIVGRWFAAPAMLKIDRPLLVLTNGRPADVPAIVTIRDHLGRIVARSGDTIRLRLEPDGKDSVAGTVAVATINGAALFDDVRVLVLPRQGSRRIAFQFGNLPVVTQPLLPWADRLVVVGGEIAGQSLLPLATIRVALGAQIRGSVRMRYSTSWPSATVMMARAASWVDRRRDTVSVTSLLTPIDTAFTSVAVDYPPPASPGEYFIVFVTGPEPNAAALLSGTNWKCGTPRWFDGNDVVDLPAADRERSSAAGYAALRADLCNSDGLTGRDAPQERGFALVRVIVR